MVQWSCVRLHLYLSVQNTQLTDKKINCFCIDGIALEDMKEVIVYQFYIKPSRSSKLATTAVMLKPIILFCMNTFVPGIPLNPSVMDMFEISPEWCLYSVAPFVLCLLAVHFLFRNIFSLIWFSVKGALAMIVFVHIRQLVVEYMEVDPVSVGSTFFGVSTETLQLTTYLALRLLKHKTTSVVKQICPSCFPSPPPPPPPPSPPSPSPGYKNWIFNMNVTAWKNPFAYI